MEEDKLFLLSSSGLKRSIVYYDFTFLVGGNEYLTSKWNASFISEKIYHLLQVDQTFDFFEIEIDDSHNEFNIIMRLMLGQPVKLSSPSIQYIIKVAKILQNPEILNYFIEKKNEKLSLENVVLILSTKHEMKLSINKEIDFIAKNFSYFMKKIIEEGENEYEIILELIEPIISSQFLIVDNEDSLYNFVVNCLGSKYNFLFNYIQFQYLSDDQLIHFFKNFNYKEDITKKIWASLMMCIIKTKPDEMIETEFNRYMCNHIILNESEPFNGVFSYLTRKYKGNPHIKGIVNVTSSSSSRSNCYDVLDYDSEDYWFSENELNSWIQFDFINLSLKLTNYSLKSDGNDANHLKNWVVEGSNDLVGWTTIDKRATSDLCHNFSVKSYECKSNEFFRYLRIRQTAPNSNYLNFLMLSNVEFFGILSCKKA